MYSERLAGRCLKPEWMRQPQPHDPGNLIVHHKKRPMGAGTFWQLYVDK